MDESAALELVANIVGDAGDDAAVVDDLVLTTDMLHAATDFPEGTSRYTAGWRAVGASLSDVAAMGARARAAVAVYAAPNFDETELDAFLRGAIDVCEAVGARYVGGDLDTHAELTIVSSVLGKTPDPVYRSGATPDEGVFVTGTLGRSAAAVAEFEAKNADRGNELFQFLPRVDAGVHVAPIASAMTDSSDGLARSLHLIAAASGCGMSIQSDSLPIDEAVLEIGESVEDYIEMGVYFGEDFELVFTADPSAVSEIRDALDIQVTQIGVTTADDVQMDGEPLPDRGYGHGSS